MLFFEILLIAMGALLLALAVYFGKGQEEKIENPVEEQPLAHVSTENAAKLQTSLTVLLNELHSMSRGMTVDLEQKLSELKELLQLADTKLEELSLANAQKRLVNEPTMEPKKEKKDSTDAPLSEVQITTENDTAAPPPSNRYEQIYQMADEEFPVDEIARRMQMGKGEIQLILSLREKD